VARNAKIRVRQKDKDLIKRINKNANAKRRYWEKKYGVETNFETRNIRSFKTRSEFNKYVKEVKKYSKRSIRVNTKLKNGYDVGKKNLATLTRLQRKANKNRASVFNKFKDVTMLAGGQSIPGNPTAGIGTIFSRGDLENFKPLDFMNRNISDEHALKIVINYYRLAADQNLFQDRLNQMKENFTSTLIAGFLPNHGDDDAPEYDLNDDPRVKRIVEIIQDMTFDEWYQIYLSDTAFDFSFAYSPEDRDKNISLLEATLERFNYDIEDPLG
jgi:hypothetical protein